MKFKHLLTLALLLACALAWAQNKPKSKSFEVCDVTAPATLLPTESYEQHLNKQLATIDFNTAVNKAMKLRQYNRIEGTEDSIYLYSFDKKIAWRDTALMKLPALFTYAEGKRDIPLLTPIANNNFIKAVELAYANHYPLVISPDMMWLLICQGFAAHVNANAEKMRHLFVEHTEGKKTLVVNIDDIALGILNSDPKAWAAMFPRFKTEIARNIKDPTLVSWIDMQFSTTTPTESTAYQITLMNALKSYFAYEGNISCGIPQVILEGTSKDWKKIAQQAERLAIYDLEWWLNDLRPILNEFVRASTGKVNKTFWQQIIQKNPYGGCGGPPEYNGWAFKLYPYENRWGRAVSNGLLTANKTPIAEKLYTELKYMPDAISQTDFMLNNNNSCTPMTLYAGFMGITQNPKTKAIRPEIAWAVMNMNRPLSAEEKKQHPNCH
jgi:hypothetical protein